MKIRHAAALAALLGLLVPLVVEGILFLHPFVAGAWLLLIWPSSVQLMALEGRPAWPIVVEVIAFSIGLNMLLYAGIGSLLAFLYLSPRTTS
jgi:hypothetical protein